MKGVGRMKLVMRTILFSAMNVLDGDDVRLSHRGQYAERDIVQVSVWVSFLCMHSLSSYHAFTVKRLFYDHPSKEVFLKRGGGGGGGGGGSYKRDSFT